MEKHDKATVAVREENEMKKRRGHFIINSHLTEISVESDDN